MLIGENASEAHLPGRGLSLIFVFWNEDGYSRPGTGKPLAQAAEMLERQWMWEEEILDTPLAVVWIPGPFPIVQWFSDQDLSWELWHRVSRPPKASLEIHLTLFFAREVNKYDNDDTTSKHSAKLYFCLSLLNPLSIPHGGHCLQHSEMLSVWPGAIHTAAI